MPWPTTSYNQLRTLKPSSKTQQQPWLFTGLFVTKHPGISFGRPRTEDSGCNAENCREMDFHMDYFEKVHCFPRNFFIQHSGCDNAWKIVEDWRLKKHCEHTSQWAGFFATLHWDHSSEGDLNADLSCQVRGIPRNQWGFLKNSFLTNRTSVGRRVGFGRWLACGFVPASTAQPSV